MTVEEKRIKEKENLKNSSYRPELENEIKSIINKTRKSVPQINK